MDIIIEGKITPDEGMSEVIQTVIDLKNLQNPILRISATDSDLQGRVAFSSGHILGGRINNSDETGYPAIRKLLLINHGNYAILDPGRQHIQDVNQTLWIEANKVIQMLPNLPQSPESLMEIEAGASTNPAGEYKPKIANIDLKAGKVDGDKTTVTNPDAPARSFNSKAWANFKSFLWCFAMLVSIILALQYGDKLLAMFQSKPADTETTQPITPGTTSTTTSTSATTATTKPTTTATQAKSPTTKPATTVAPAKH